MKYKRIDCDKDCPYKHRMPDEGAIRYYQSKTSFCAKCGFEQLRTAEVEIERLKVYFEHFEKRQDEAMNAKLFVDNVTAQNKQQITALKEKNERLTDYIVNNGIICPPGKDPFDIGCIDSQEKDKCKKCVREALK